MKSDSLNRGVIAWRLGSGEVLLWIGACLLSLTGSLGLVRLAFGAFRWSELGVGWLLALLSAAASSYANRRGVAGGRAVFLKGLAWNGVRAVTVLVIVIAVRWWWMDDDGFYSFLIAFFVGYFIFQFMEIARLQGADKE